MLFSLAFDADEFEFNSEDAAISVFSCLSCQGDWRQWYNLHVKINKGAQTTVNVQLKEFHNYNNKIKRPTTVF